MDEQTRRDYSWLLVHDAVDPPDKGESAEPIEPAYGISDRGVYNPVEQY